MPIPDNISCLLSRCNYSIIMLKQNKDIFLQNCSKTLKLLNEGKIINISLRCQSYLYGKKSEKINIIQIAECFDSNFFKDAKNLQVNMKNGLILISPFSEEIKSKLSEILNHNNIKIITYDFTADLTYLMSEGIKVNIKSVIDGNISKNTGSKLFELPFSSLITACNKSKLLRPNKNSKNKKSKQQNYHTSNEFHYLLQNSDYSINDLFNDQFWESIASDCAYVAHAFYGSFSKYGIAEITRSTEEKIKAFREIQEKYGTFGPLLMKKFFNADQILHSNEILNENVAYEAWSATHNVISNFDLYNKIVPNDKKVTKKEIFVLHKKSENVILGNDINTGLQELLQTLNEEEERMNKAQKNFNNALTKKSETKNFDTSKFISKTMKSKSGNSQVDNLILIIENYVKQTSPFLPELKQIWDDLFPKFSKIHELILTTDQLFRAISQSIQNIKNFVQKTARLVSIDSKVYMSYNFKDVLASINILLTFLSNDQIKAESKAIGKKLFNVVFNPKNDGTCLTKILAVYKMTNDFLSSQETVANFESSTGSGKTRCAPFIFAIRAIEDDMKRPFFIMTQPGFSIIKDKIKDFENIIGDSVRLIKDIWEMVDLYTKFYSYRNDRNQNKELFTKPIVGLFSPQSLLLLINKLQKKRINICTVTRFCLDEFHERSVESDVLEAILSSKINTMINYNKNFPFQLLMMSATPDSRIVNCFKKVTRFSLPNSQLFPVENINKQVDNRNKVNEEVVSQTFEIIRRMVNNQVRNGHILIFTSGNSRINDIQEDIFENAEEKCSSKYCLVHVIKCFDSLFKDGDIKQFYLNLDAYIHREINKIDCQILFLLPIKYMGYVSNEQKEIGKNPITKYPNLIKIIMATNAIESSITIDGLAAVVDSGLFNHSTYDKNNGLTSLNEEPISIQSQTQRSGRVGRTRPGISVHIKVKNQKLQNLLPPAIKTSDISLNILSLRKIDYKLEEIKNLPDPLDKKEIQDYISKLESFHALTKNTHNLTPYGRILGSFPFVSPFIAAAILKVAGYEMNENTTINAEKLNDQSEIDKEFRLLLGVLVSLLFGAPDLCINKFSRKLRFYFDKRSDIITLLRTLLDLAQMKTFEIKNRAFDYGLNAQIAVKLLGQVQQTAENLFLSPKELHQIIQHKNQKNKNQDQDSQEVDVNQDLNAVKIEKSVSNKLLIIKKSSENLISQEEKDETNQNNENQKKDENNQSEDNETETNNNENQKDKNGPKIDIKQDDNSNEQNKNEENHEATNAPNDSVKPDNNNSNEQNKNEENQEVTNAPNDSVKPDKNNSNENINVQIDEILSEKKKYFNRRTLFRHLKELVEKLILEDKLFQFIQDLIDEIGHNKPEWISCRRVQFATIQNASTEPSFIYNGSKSLSQNNSASFIVMKMRPGSVGLDSPGSAFMLSITHESNCKMNFGSLIHCDLVSEEKDHIPHPISIETSVELFNDFSEPLIEAYLGDNQSHFKKFCRERWNLFNEGNCLLFKSQDVTSSDRKHNAKQVPKHYFSFIPKDEKSVGLFVEASKFIEPLLPYTPSTILIKNSDLKCTVAIHGVGTDKIDSSAHFFTDDNYFAYQINQRTIKFLIKNIAFLSSVDELISIGMTGESLCYPLGDSNVLSKNSSKIFYPHCNSSCSSVFGNEFFFYSHLVMLSKVKFPRYEEYSLPWISEHSAFDLVDDDLIFHAANGIAREFINVRKAFSRILFTTDSSYLIIKGENLPDSIQEYRYSRGGNHELMNKLFTTCVSEYIQGDSLIKPIDFTAVFYGISKDDVMPDIGYIPNTKTRKVFGYGCACLDVVDENQKSIDDVKLKIKEQYSQYEEMRRNCRDVLRENDEIKKDFIDKIILRSYKLKTDFLKYFIYSVNYEFGDFDFIDEFQPIIPNEINDEIQSSIKETAISFSGINSMLFNSMVENYDSKQKLLIIILNDHFIRSSIVDNILLDPMNRIKYNDYCTSLKTSFYTYSALIGIFRRSKGFETVFLDTIKNDASIRELILKRMINNLYLMNAINELMSNKDVKKRIFYHIWTLKIKEMLLKHFNEKSDEFYEYIKTNEKCRNQFIKSLLNSDFDAIFQSIYENYEIRNKIQGIIKRMPFKQEMDKNKIPDPEVLQLYYVTIKHGVHSSLTKEQFIEKITSVVKQFGALIAKQFEYSEAKRVNNIQKGQITILLYSSYFTLPLVGMIKEALQENNSNSTLRIPNNIIDNVLLSDSSVSNILRNWFKENELDIKQNDLQLIGDEENIKKALEKLNKNPPSIPFNAYPIQSHANLFQINNQIKHLNRNKTTKWYLNPVTRTILIPSSEDQEEVSKYLDQFLPNFISNNEEQNDDIERILWDINFHEESAILSRYLINIYLQNGKLIQRHFCVDCVYETFNYNLRKMYNQNEDRGDYQEIINDDQMIQQMSFVQCKQIKSEIKTKKNLFQVFPVIPFGQLLWSFINEPKIANQARTWITALAIRTLKKTPNITFCPLHPYILFPSPPQGYSMNCKIPNCCFSLCPWCHKWHKNGECDKSPKIPPGDRECPYCHEVIEKMKMCNHIKCRCGREFCYYCGIGFDDQDACYEHMTKENHWEEAPDYLKYIKNKFVSFEELEKFYVKYPKWRPVLSKSDDDDDNKKVDDDDDDNIE